MTLNPMSVSWFPWLGKLRSHSAEESIAPIRTWQKFTAKLLLLLMVGLSCLMLWGTPSAWAGLNDDRFDGNIFPLYAGDGSLVPPKVPLSEALQRSNPILLVYYIDDSSDCKQYVPVISGLSRFYGRVSDFIPVSIDTIPVKTTYEPTEPGYYYKGVVPQTVLIDQSGKVVLDEKGILSFDQVDNVFRQVFDLLPRSESVELKRRSVNEVSTEIAK
jgi:hypothetical protein